VYARTRVHTCGKLKGKGHIDSGGNSKLMTRADLEGWGGGRVGDERKMGCARRPTETIAARD